MTAMPTYRLVRISGNHWTVGWGVQEVEPGKKPITLSFRGTKTDTTAEVRRLTKEARERAEILRAG
jgi:hypothetical protein